MNELLPKEKLVRFGQVVNQQSDNIRFADKLYERVKDAESILVKDPTGLHFYYFPKFEGETDAQAFAGRPVAIPKAFVEKFDEEAIKEAAESEVPKEVDLESTEHLKAQVKAWIDTSVLGEEIEYTEDDLIRFISSHGTPEKGKFVVTVAKNGKLDSTARAEQKRFSSDRTDIQEKIKELAIAEIVVGGANFDEVRKQLSELFTFEDGKDLYQSDIILPMTHMREGQTYIASVSPYSFDYFGQFYFKIAKPDEDDQEELLEISQIKFSHDGKSSDVDNRFMSNLNSGDMIFIVFDASGITKPVKASLVEVTTQGEKRGVFESVEKVITVTPGMNVIPYTVPVLQGSFSGVPLAIVNKEASSWEAPERANIYTVSRGINFHSPSVEPVTPILSSPLELTLEDASSGINSMWNNFNANADYSFKKIEWSCNILGSSIEILDTSNETSVRVILPETFKPTENTTVVITLETDAGTVTTETIVTV